MIFLRFLNLATMLTACFDTFAFPIRCTQLDREQNDKKFLVRFRLCFKERFTKTFYLCNFNMMNLNRIPLNMFETRFIIVFIRLIKLNRVLKQDINCRTCTTNLNLQNIYFHLTRQCSEHVYRRFLV